MHKSLIEKEKRFCDDRRSTPTPAISRYTFFGGRRKALRRNYDVSKYFFVDQHGTWLFAAFMMLLLLSILDAYLTVVLIDKGRAIEINPVMAFYLEHGIVTFTITKFLMTAMFITIFCLFQNYYVRSYCLVERAYKNVYITRMSLPLVIKFYLLVVIYEFYLFLV